MSEYKTGGPAFPTVGSQYSHEEGMTLRDYFAAKAMQSFIEIGTTFDSSVARDSYRYADAMLAEREKQQ